MSEFLSSTTSTSPDATWWVGILLEIFASFSSTLGKELFRLAAMRSQLTPITPNGARPPGRPVWSYYVAAVGCAMLLSPAMDGAAYAFTAQSILSACAGLVLLWNILLAPVLLDEKITLSRFGSAVVIVLGTVGVGLSGNHREQRMFDSGQWGRILTRGLACAYYLMLLGWIVICWYLSGKQRDPASKSLVKACLGGSVTGGTQFLTKAAISLLKCAALGTEGGDVCARDHPFEHPTLYIATPLTLLFHALALFALADALRSCDALVAIAMYEGMVILSGTICGNLVLGEMIDGYTPVPTPTHPSTHPITHPPTQSPTNPANHPPAFQSPTRLPITHPHTHPFTPPPTLLAQLAAFFYVTSLLLILIGLILVVKWPSYLGKGDEEITALMARAHGRLPAWQAPFRAPLKATEGSKLLDQQRT